MPQIKFVRLVNRREDIEYLLGRSISSLRHRAAQRWVRDSQSYLNCYQAMDEERWDDAALHAMAVNALVLGLETVAALAQALSQQLAHDEPEYHI